MRSPFVMDTVQIEITNACMNTCSNCTRFCGHHPDPYFMSLDMFKAAVDSMEGYPKMVGIMGGEPLLHPDFELFCEYAREKIGYEHLGLWTALPAGKEHYRETICKTFKHIFLNDHSKGGIYHHPLLVASREVMSHDAEIYLLADNCWIQNCWSAAINPNGAFFCEVAAAMSLLFNKPETAWPVEKGWWWRTPKDFKEQIEEFCPRCGGALPFRRRESTDRIDDLSPENFKLIEATSPKIKKGLYAIHDLNTVPRSEMQPMAAYKDESYRQDIAARYGMFLQLNEQGFQTPYLTNKPPQKRKSYFQSMREEWEQQNGNH